MRLKYLFFLLVLVAFVGSVVFFLKDALFHRSKAPREARELTSKLLNLSRRYSRPSLLTGKQPDLNEVVATATQRKEELLRVIEDNPQAFLETALTADQLADVPQEIKDRGLVEKTVQTQGKLAVIVIDDLDKQQEKLEFYLDEPTTETVEYQLHFASNEPEMLLTDTQVAASGKALGNELVLATGGNQDLQVVTQALLTEPGVTERFAVIMFNFMNDHSQPMTPTDIHRRMIDDTDSMRAYYLENSYGAIENMTADVYGYFTIPYEKNTGYCDSYTWAIAADAAAFQSGVNITSYSRRVYVFPGPNNCTGSAWATLGGNPSRMWMPGNSYTPILSHEFGHNLGLGHASFLQCSPGYSGSPLENVDCPSSEYGDPFAIMGWSQTHDHFNAVHKTFLDWFAPEQVITATQSGVYSITPIETSDGVKAVQIDLPQSVYSYYLSYRQPIGVDADLPPAITNGAQLHATPYDVYAGSRSFLIDVNPPPSLRSDAQTSTFEDGDVFTDPVQGVTITQLSHSNTEVNLNVQLNYTGCRINSPTVEISPFSQSAVLDQTVTYTVTVTNTDSPDCSASTFYVYGYYYQMDLNMDPNEFSLHPQESKTITVTILVPPESNLSLGSHTVDFYTRGNDDGRHSAHTTFDFVLTGSLGQVAINPGSIDTTVGLPPTQLSALAYDEYSRPIWSGVSYEWGMSSDNTVGTVQPDYNIASFLPLNPGSGDLWVIARYGNDFSIGSIRVTVAPSNTPQPSVAPPPSASASPTGAEPDLDGDNDMDVKDVLELVAALVSQSERADLNNDGNVDVFDFAVLVARFGR